MGKYRTVGEKGAGFSHDRRIRLPGWVGDAEGVVDDIAPKPVRSPARDIGGCPAESGFLDRPVDDEERDVAGDIHVARAYVDGGAHNSRVGRMPLGAGGWFTRPGDQNAAVLVKAVDRARVAAVESAGEHRRMGGRVGGEWDAVFMGHASSTAAGAVAHQTVSGWDRELVPDASGQVARPTDSCPVEVALAAISGRWTTLVLRELMTGPRSFGELAAHLPALSDKVLTERLARLRRQGLVDREVSRGFPSRTTYTLTPAGTQLRPLLVELYRTGLAIQASFGA